MVPVNCPFCYGEYALRPIPVEPYWEVRCIKCNRSSEIDREREVMRLQQGKEVKEQC